MSVAESGPLDDKGENPVGTVGPEEAVRPSVDSESAPDRVFFASDPSDSTYDEVRDRLEEDGIEVEDLDPDGIDCEGGEFYLNGEPVSELDASVYLRPKRWTDVGEDWEGFSDLLQLQAYSSIDFYGDPHTAVLAEDKKATKNVFRNLGIGVVDDLSYDEALKQVEEGEEVVVKPRFNSSHGNGVEAVSSQSRLETYREDILEGDYLVEDKLEHGEDSENADMRMVLTGDDFYRAERVGGDGVASNISNGGDYRDPDPLSFEEFEMYRKASEAFGNGFISIDYVREEDGSVNVMEINSTSYTSIDEHLDDNLYDSIAEGLESSFSGGGV
ncbi:MAG: RimK family alpha-L-glutamate ligase [Candidatus Nanohalobium sp.]